VDVSDKVTEVTQGSFEKEVLAQPGLVVIDFWAPWCGPCRAVSPILDQIADEYHGRVKVVKINTDDEPELATRYNIRSIPTVMILRGGKVLQTLIGSRPKAQFTAVLEKELGVQPSA
jgi:thioredoxin 1